MSGFRFDFTHSIIKHCTPQQQQQQAMKQAALEKSLLLHLGGASSSGPFSAFGSTTTASSLSSSSPASVIARRGADGFAPFADSLLMATHAHLEAKASTDYLAFLDDLEVKQARIDDGAMVADGADGDAFVDSSNNSVDLFADAMGKSTTEWIEEILADAGVSPQLGSSAVIDDSALVDDDGATMQLDSTRRKRKKMMRKHKWKKLRKRDRK